MMDGVASPGAPQRPQTPQPQDRRSRLVALRDIVLGPDSYGIVFVFLVVDYVFLTIGWRGSVAIIVSVTWLGLAVLLAFRTSQVPHRLMLVVRVAVAVVVVAAVAVAFGGGERADGTVVILSSLLVLASPIAIGWRILHHARVTTQTVLGALCIYILIGLIFANADYGVQLVWGHSFFAQPGQHGPADFAYFSYITMATVGYGDLTPAVGLPRTNAVLEALIGQIFLVVLVARLVGMYTPTFRWSHELGRESEGGPGGPGGPGAAGGGPGGAAGSGAAAGAGAGGE
jgi:Ion channel